MIQMNISMTENHKERLTEYKKTIGLSYSEVIRRALDLFFKEHDREEVNRKTKIAAIGK